MKNKPPYALESVDNALRLVQLLRDHGRLRVSEAAHELGIARSTAHRLLAMLVYRGFAEQDEARGYVQGSALAAATPLATDLRRLSAAALPVMERLCERVEETVNLMVRAGTHARFLTTVESTQILHVGDRRGTILPAAKASGGKALLAEVSDEDVAALYGIGSAAPSLTDAEWAELVTDLAVIRRRGYAVNEQGTEAGVWALGMAVRDGDGVAVAALSVALPSARYRRAGVGALVRELRGAVEAVQARIAGHTVT